MISHDATGCGAQFAMSNSRSSDTTNYGALDAALCITGDEIASLRAATVNGNRFISLSCPNRRCSSATKGGQRRAPVTKRTFTAAFAFRRHGAEKFGHVSFEQSAACSAFADDCATADAACSLAVAEVTIMTDARTNPRGSRFIVLSSAEVRSFNRLWCSTFRQR
jgi:hypothetical protein